MADLTKVVDDTYAKYFVEGATDYTLSEIMDSVSQWGGKLERMEVRSNNYQEIPRTMYGFIYEFDDRSEAELHVVTDSNTNQLIRHTLRVLCVD